MDIHPLKILLVEDNPTDARSIREALVKEIGVPFQLDHADCLSSAITLLGRDPVHIVLLDLQLPDSKGLSAVVKIREAAPQVPIVVLTASDDDELAVQALQQGAQDYLVKGYIQVYRNLLGRSMRYAIERQRADDELLQAHAQTEQLLSSITSILIGVSPEGLVTHWNRVAEATLGRPAAEVMQRPLASCGVQWESEKILRCVADCRSCHTPLRLDDVRYTRPGGEEGLLGLTVIPMKRPGVAEPSVLLFGADLTERRQAEAERVRLQEELLQAQKMETIGRFAGGIAHDFENFLQVILGFAWLIRARHREDRELISDLQEIVHAAESASGMVRQLLAFSRRQALKPTILEINRTVEHMAKMLEQVVGEAVRLHLELTSEALLVKVDPTAFEQIIMNLCSNARDSMRQGGTLTIQTAAIVADAAFRDAHPAATMTGDCARLSVADTGLGMEPSVAANIFEPFFTTKRSGQGTGLGLAVVYGLVRQHEGWVEVETAPGRGTTFHLYFVRHELSAGQRRDLAADAPAAPSQRVETVLILEPDPRQRQLAEDVLRESGYQVAGSYDATQAVERVTQCSSRPDTVVLDSTALEGDAAELLQRIRVASPQIKILIVSGRRDERLRAVAETIPGVQVLRKPYVPAQLLESLRALLDERRPRLLVVDDDGAVRTLCQRILESSYEVTTAASGPEALAALEGTPFDALLTDMKMPDMDGVELIQEALRRHPDLHVLAMSGLLTSEMEQRLRAAASRCDVLRKPFTAAALEDAVKRCV